MFKEHDIEGSDENVKRLWGCYSTQALHSQNYFVKEYGRALLKRSTCMVGGYYGKTTLDCGCGSGFLYEHLLTGRYTANKYIGLDFSERQ